MRIQAIVFDLFGTLVHQFPLDRFQGSLAEMASAIGFDYQTFFDAWTKETSFKRQTGGFVSFREELQWICESKGIDVSAENMERAIQLRCSFTKSVLTPRSDSIQTINHLKKSGYLIGLISDCSCEVPELWSETPFRGHFDATVFSCLVKTKKPDANIYLIACDRLGVKPSECIYIGDGFSQELQGAALVGMRPFLLLPPGERRPSSTDWEGTEWTGETISAISQIIGVLESRRY